MIIRQITHTTFLLDYAGSRFLIDPFFGEEPSEGTAFSWAQILNVDAIIVTELKGRQFAEKAKKRIPKKAQIFVPHTEDQKELDRQGFFHLEVLCEDSRFQYLDVRRTPAFTEEDGKILEEERSCGVLISHPVLNSVYFTGSTVWSPQIRETIRTYKPRMIIVNTGAECPKENRRHLMTHEEIAAVHLAMPKAKIIAAQSGCGKEEAFEPATLRQYLTEHHMEENVLIPEAGKEYLYV